MASSTFTVHTAVLFDPWVKRFLPDRSITVDRATGTVHDVYDRGVDHADVNAGDIDLRDKIVMPGFVDAHTHIFLHSYQSVDRGSIPMALA